MRKSILFIILILSMTTALWGGDTFRVVFSETKVDFDPHRTFTATEAQLYTALFEGLVTYHPKTLEPLPGAAESWEISDDGMTYTFKLRDGLKYSNGDKVTAAHFRDSWLRLMSPETGSDYGSLLDVVKNGAAYREGRIPAGELGIEAVNDGILKVTLEQKTPHLLKVLCHHSFAPVHPDFYRTSGKNLIVNGPFRIESLDTGEIRFMKNENYWDKDNVSIENLTVRFSNDDDKNTVSFNRDETDWLADSFNLSLLNIEEAVVFNPLFSTTYLYFSNRQDVWKNGNVRKAMALLLPWGQIRATQMIPDSALIPSIPGYPETAGIKEADGKEAMRLLEQEGYPGGKGLPPIRLRFPESQSMLQIGELIKKSWEENLGVSVEIVSEPFPHYYSSLKKDDYTLGALTWIGDYADPMTFLEMWLKTSSLNDAGFSDREYDSKISRSTGADLEERYKLMGEAESILLDTAQVMPLGHSPALNLIDLRFIEGWYPNVLDIHPFKYLKFRTDYQIPGSV